MGSNIRAEEHLRAAADGLRTIFPDCTFSHVYSSDPLERTDQLPFLNAVARIETRDPPEAVATALRSIESALGKNPPFRFGPRTIDLDLLLYDDLILPNKEEWLAHYPLPTIHHPLFIPHPRMHKRRFVLEPLLELVEQNSVHPVLHTLFSELLTQTSDQACCRIRLTL